VVFREYPFSVVEGIDLGKYTVLGSPLGKQVFGPIFSMGVDVEGRKVYDYEKVLGPDTSLNGDKCNYSSAAKPLKHLDVAVITDQDVTASSLGRSDNDTYNISSVFNVSLDPEGWKYNLREILPFINPISVMRHGVRSREQTTRFANFSRDFLCGKRGSGVDNVSVRNQIVRWALLCDHWNQHNIEYLSGTITLRGRPDIRVGYRLDWKDRHESYYVEQVSHEWSYPGALRTTVQVTRGQRNDPFPAYIPPPAPAAEAPAGFTTPFVFTPAEVANRNRLATNATSAFVLSGGGDRTNSGRLAKFFMTRDTNATVSAVGSTPDQHDENTLDKPDNASGKGIAVYVGRELVSGDDTAASTQIDNLSSANSNPAARQRIPE
jgi:hypothetical protein